jgi:uncharacterized membrane protein YkvA (DUF1232 family)
MQFDKQKALDIAKNLANNFDPKAVEDFIQKHKDSQFVADVKILFSMVMDSIKGNYTISKTTFATIAGALAYVALPTDVIPDFIPVVGLLDDAFVVNYTLKAIKDELENYKRFKGEETRQIK